MKVAVDFQSAAGKPTGIGSFAANLVACAKAEAPDIDWLLYFKPSEDLNTASRIFWESAEIPMRALGDKPDILYSPGFAPAFFSPCPQVVTVHDLIGMIYPSNQRSVSAFYWSRWLPAALRRAKRLVASSESTRRDIERLLGIPASKIEVVLLSADEAYRKIDDRTPIDEALWRFGIVEPFFISVSTLEPRKNLLKLLEAYEILRKEGKAKFRLVLAGKPGAAQAAIRTFIEEKSLGDHVKVIGYASKEDIVALYNASIGYVCVSLYEGFGLPALEAMRCGKSGVCSDRSSLPEVVGKAALSVNPEDARAIASALDSYAADAALRRGLEGAAEARAAQFSSRRTARRMVEIFREVHAN